MALFGGTYWAYTSGALAQWTGRGPGGRKGRWVYDRSLGGKKVRGHASRGWGKGRRWRVGGVGHSSRVLQRQFCQRTYWSYRKQAQPDASQNTFTTGTLVRVLTTGCMLAGVGARGRARLLQLAPRHV